MYKSQNVTTLLTVRNEIANCTCTRTIVDTVQKRQGYQRQLPFNLKHIPFISCTSIAFSSQNVPRIAHSIDIDSLQFTIVCPKSAPTPSTKPYSRAKRIRCYTGTNNVQNCLDQKSAQMQGFRCEYEQVTVNTQLSAENFSYRGLRNVIAVHPIRFALLVTSDQIHLTCVKIWS